MMRHNSRLLLQNILQWLFPLSLLLGTNGCSTLGQAAKMDIPSNIAQATYVEEEPKTLVERFSPTRLAAEVRGETPDQDAARGIFEQAEKQFKAAATATGKSRQEAFQESAKLYRKAATRGKGFPVEEDALLMVAECHFFADNYPKASEGYGKLIKRFPNSQYLDRVDSRRFAIAEFWLNHHKQEGGGFVPNLSDDRLPALDKFGHATKLFDRIRFDDPTGELSDDATMAAAVAYFERGKYVKADEMFSDIRENFPGSQHQFDAHLLGLKAKMLSYEGADYDGGPLEEAEEIIRSVAVQFPDKAQDHYEPLDTAFKKIRLQKAERQFAHAQYYDRRKEYRAARMHYERVRKDYSDTSLAVEAESRLAQIKGFPDVPKPSMEWLQNLFPESTKRQEPLIRRNPTGSTKK